MAVDQAPNGALLLVRPGPYGGSPMQIVGKSLRIEGDGSGTVAVLGGLEIRDLAATQEAYLGGLSFVAGFLVENCVGDVALTGCRSLNTGLSGAVPADLQFFDFGDCRAGAGSHQVRNSGSVTLADFALQD